MASCLECGDWIKPSQWICNSCDRKICKSDGKDLHKENFRKLKEIANHLGYSVNIVPDHYVSSCGHLTKHINISKKSGEIKSVFEFAHELGHCKQFIIVWDKMKGNKEEVKQLYRERDKKKYKFMLNEVEAWLLGYYILKEKEINTYGYWKHAFHCLKSHLLKTKPNSVKG